MGKQDDDKGFSYTPEERAEIDREFNRIGRGLVRARWGADSNFGPWARGDWLRVAFWAAVILGLVAWRLSGVCP